MTLPCADGEKLNEIVMDMMKHTRSTVSDLYYLQGKLYELFSVLASDVVIEELMEENKENRYIQEAVTYIRNHYAAGLTVEEPAGSERSSAHESEEPGNRKKLTFDMFLLTKRTNASL